MLCIDWVIGYPPLLSKEVVAEPEVISRTTLNCLQHLPLCQTVDVSCLFSEIQAGEVEREVVVVVISHAKIPLPVGFYVGGIGSRSFRLTYSGNKIVAPVVSETNLQVFA